MESLKNINKKTCKIKKTTKKRMWLKSYKKNPKRDEIWKNKWSQTKTILQLKELGPFLKV
jgi:hypothetical protein